MVVNKVHGASAHTRDTVNPAREGVQRSQWQRFPGKTSLDFPEHRNQYVKATYTHTHTYIYTDIFHHACPWKGRIETKFSNSY